MFAVSITFHSGTKRRTQSSQFLRPEKESDKSTAGVWTRIMRVNGNKKIETITATELLDSKFASFIGESTGDYEPKTERATHQYKF